MLNVKGTPMLSSFVWSLFIFILVFLYESILSYIQVVCMGLGREENPWKNMNQNENMLFRCWFK